VFWTGMIYLTQMTCIVFMKTIVFDDGFLKKATQTLRVFYARPFRAASSHPLCGW
jgi:hypothetical protein